MDLLSDEFVRAENDPNQVRRDEARLEELGPRARVEEGRRHCAEGMVTQVAPCAAPSVISLAVLSAGYQTSRAVRESSWQSMSERRKLATNASGLA